MKRLLAPAAVLLLLTACASTGTQSSNDTAGTTTPSSSPSAADPAAAVRAWAQAGGSSAMTGMSNDLTQVKAGLSARDFSALQTSCAKLTSDVETDLAGDPIPDKTAATEWNLALTHLQKAANACTLAASSGDASQLDVMTSEMTIGLNHFTAFTTRLDQFMG